MKIYHQHLRLIAPTTSKMLVFAVLFSLLPQLTGCQLNGQTNPLPQNRAGAGTSSQANFSQYYLSLKNLNPTQVLNEIERIKQIQQASSAPQETAIYLLLLKSLPSSPIYNPYNAKDQLNQLPAEILSRAYLSGEDLALLTLLKDQLNEQLFAHERINALEQEQALSQQAFNLQLNGLQSSLTELQQKLTQLKKIETAIDKHEQ